MAIGEIINKIKEVLRKQKLYAAFMDQQNIKWMILKLSQDTDGNGLWHYTTIRLVGKTCLNSGTLSLLLYFHLPMT